MISFGLGWVCREEGGGFIFCCDDLRLVFCDG